jgi:pyruvate kinase
MGELMRRYRATKIIATLGPASSKPETIEKLFLSGVDIFRLNFSHATHDFHRQNFEWIREVEKKHQRPIGILQDLQGPKLRVGRFQDGRILLEQGQQFTLDLTEQLGTQERVTLPHPEIFEALRPGSALLLNDGKIRLLVESCDSHACQTVVVYGGELSDNKGVNVPDVTLPISALTEKDIRDLEFGLGLGVDWVALSFVQRPKDLEHARELIQGRAGIVSKIEKPMAIQHLEDIVNLSDAVMIARGDLGVEMLPEEVPSVQKQIIRECRAQGRPVLVATQMLESMITNPTPTRAEASDVATAVYDGVDAVMLSAESASGQYPVEAVTMMNRIIEQVEADPYYRKILDSQHQKPDPTPADAITDAARSIAETLSLKAIVTLTSSGTTAIRASRERPNAPLIAITPENHTAHLLTLTWGVHSILLPKDFAGHSFSDMIELIGREILTGQFAMKDDQVLVTVGRQWGNEVNQELFQNGNTCGLYIIKV